MRSGAASEMSSALMSSAMFTTGTNAVHALSSMPRSIVTPAGIASSMYTGVRKFCPSLKSLAKAAMARNTAVMNSVTGSSIAKASSSVDGETLIESPGRMRITVAPSDTMLARAASRLVIQTARYLPVTISIGLTGAQSSVCIVPALLLAGREVDGRVEPAEQRHGDQEERQEEPENLPGPPRLGRHVGRRHVEAEREALDEAERALPIRHEPFAVRVEARLEPRPRFERILPDRVEVDRGDAGPHARRPPGRSPARAPAPRRCACR